MLPVYLAALSFVSSVAADYHIDNADSTVSYAASGTSWNIYSFTTQNITFALDSGNITVDSSKCYHKSYSLATCTVQNQCKINFAFKGSGITVYITHAGLQGVAASLTIDGGQSVTATLPPPAPPSYQTPNVTLFDLQSIPSAYHNATINLLDWENNGTSLYFDYAYVNESSVDSPSGSSITSSSKTSGAPVASGITPTVSNASPSINLAAVVGGMCGGFVVLISIVTAIIFIRRRRSRQAKVRESRRPDPFPNVPPLVRDQVSLFPGHSQPSMKERMRLAARNTLHHSRRPTDGEASDIHFYSTSGSPMRVSNAGPSPSGPFSNDDYDTDIRSDGSSLFGSRSVGYESSPPSYQRVDPRYSNAPLL